MTLNILFFSITIKKREQNLESAINNETAYKLYEDTRNRQASLFRLL
jgi:uncharacterized protein (TIGR02413 family)